MFDHVQYRNRWLADETNLGKHNDAERYGVKVQYLERRPIWGVVGVHHLTPEENRGRQNIYVDVVDENNKRYPPSNGIGIGWDWEGRFDTQPAPVKPLDKPDNEPNGNVDMYRGMKTKVWISHTVQSDVVTGLTTELPDELGPNGEIWNSVGHHSFYILFKLYGDVVDVDPPPTKPDDSEEVARLRECLRLSRESWVLARNMAVDINGLANASIRFIDDILGGCMTKVTLGGFVADDATREYINEVLDSGRLSYGPFSRTFEQQWAALHDSSYAVLSNSGTSALVVALQAAKEYYGWADGDQVIVPALTFVATVNAVLHNNLTPILVDVEVDYYNMDVDEIEATITPLTRAIIPVHLFGQPANMPVIMEIAKRHELVVIEDSCETVLATIDNKPVGSWGDMGCFSTYAAHTVVTGVGGLTTTSNPMLERLLRSLVNHGIDLDQLPTGDKYDPTFLARVFSFSRIGHSFRITELEAAIGVAQLQGIFHNVHTRQRNANILSKILHDCRGDIQLPAVRPNATHTYMMYPIVMLHQPKEYIKGYLAEHDIEVRDMVPLTNQPCYRNLFKESDYPVAEWINACGFYIGCHQGLTESEMVYAAETIYEFLKG